MTIPYYRNLIEAAISTLRNCSRELVFHITSDDHKKEKGAPKEALHEHGYLGLTGLAILKLFNQRR
jgi:hypothetical protein